MEIDGVRGWVKQRLEFPFPITALTGENGMGKSTVLQAIAASYKSEYFASDFFPDTPWEQVRNAEIRVTIREGATSGSFTTSVRKLTERWRGNDERRERDVQYIDLRRIQPIAARVGFARIAKKENKETTFEVFDPDTMERFSCIMGRDYELGKLSMTEWDTTRKVPVLMRDGDAYSGFHGGAGETVLAELLARKVPRYSILLIDEIETSLHPRTQRRLIRDIATLCRRLELQCVLTTHSPYVLDELPPEGRVYLMESDKQKRIVVGISPAFAMTKMDEQIYPEADVYVEDDQAAVMINEIVARSNQCDLILSFEPVAYGAANAGRILGLMAKERRFPRPTIVFLDGDQDAAEGCVLLPGGDAPERVVFEALAVYGMGGLAARLGRSPSNVADACAGAMVVSDHHEWVKLAADRLAVTGKVLWQSMCAEWCLTCLPESEATRIGEAILTTIVEYGGSRHTARPQFPVQSPLFPGSN
ncbi:MAG TPA: ATP-binding protein [Bryobacteraceae bacterium]|nr:ATP-binding protein [Bryobacteraceae bacterium]